MVRSLRSFPGFPPVDVSSLVDPLAFTRDCFFGLRASLPLLPSQPREFLLFIEKRVCPLRSPGDSFSPPRLFFSPCGACPLLLAPGPALSVPFFYAVPRYRELDSVT